MKKKQTAFAIDSLRQAEEIIFETKKINVAPIIFLKSFFLEGFGSEYVLNFRNILKSKFGDASFKLFVDCKFDNGQSIYMITKKIDYIKLRGKSKILKKIDNIAYKNKVLLNPTIDIVDCRNRKNIKLIIKKSYSRN